MIRRFAYLAGVSAAALMLAEACSDAVGEMMVDAGEMLTDAGSMLADGGVGRSDAGQLLREAGQALADAGQSLKDSGSEGAAQSGSGSKSGTRIEMRRFTQNGADGSVHEQYVGPFDTQLNTACNVQGAADDKLRCLPVTAVYIGAIYYSDSGCSRVLGYTNAATCAAPASLPSYALRQEVAGCSASGVRYHVHPVTGVYTGTAYAGTPASCSALPATAATAYRFLSLGAEVPASSFVEFSAVQSSPI